MDEPNYQQTAEQAAAFQKIWLNSVNQLLHASMPGANPAPPPPEVTRQMREGILRALAESWDEFMRSPQFLATMKEWIESAINFNKLTREMLGKSQEGGPAGAADELRGIFERVEGLEKRLLQSMAKVEADIVRIRETLATLGAEKSVRPGRHGTRRQATAGQTRRRTSQGKRSRA